MANILSGLVTGLAGLVSGLTQNKNTGTASSAPTTTQLPAGTNTTPSSMPGTSATNNQSYVPQGTHFDATATSYDATNQTQIKSAIEQAQADWTRAYQAGDQAGMERAHQQAEAYRAQLGYSGGGDGSQYIGMQQQMPQVQAPVVQAPPAVGAPTYPFQYDNYNDFYAQNGYDSAMQAQRDAINAYIQQTVNSINNQKGNVTQDAEALARQAYISNMQSKMTLPQQLSAAGFSGGMADSHMIGLDTTLQNNQREIMTQRDKMLNELEMAAINAQLSGDQQAAEQAAALYQAAIGAWNNYTGQANSFAQGDHWNAANMNNSNYWNALEMNNSNYWNAQNMNNSNYWNGQNLGLSQQQLALQQQGQQTSDSQWNTESAYTRAMNLLQMGVMPDEQTLQAAGISGLEASGYVQALQQQQAQATASKSSGSSGGGGSGGSAGGAASADLYADMAAANDPYLFIMSNFKNYGLSSNTAAQQVYDNWVTQMMNAFNAGDHSDAVIQSLLRMGYTMAELQAAGYNPNGTAPAGAATSAQGPNL